MATQIHKNKKVLISLAIIAILAVGAALYIKVTADAQRKRNEQTALENHAKNDTPTDQNTQNSANNNTAKPSTSANASNTPLAAPILLKSSGNNGPVPAGANIEFVCQAAAGYNCAITLTSKASSANVINLESKTIPTSQSSNTGINWYWTAVKGNWSVVAKLSSSDGRSSSSPAQTLEVQ